MIHEPPAWDEDPWVPYWNSTTSPQDCGFGRFLVVPYNPCHRVPLVNTAHRDDDSDSEASTTGSISPSEREDPFVSGERSPVVTTVPLLAEDGWYYNDAVAQDASLPTYKDSGSYSDSACATPLLSPASATSSDDNWCPDLDIFPWEDDEQMETRPPFLSSDNSLGIFMDHGFSGKDAAPPPGFLC
jgi:hypothetical protein